MTEEKWVSPVMQQLVEKMRSRNLTIAGFRDRRGRLRYTLSNNEIVTRQTVKAMMDRGMLELAEEKEGIAYYRLAVK